MIIVTIGRDENNRIIINDPSQLVSNYHAELKIKDNGTMYLYDKSTNGTFVNGTRIPKNQDFPVYRNNAVTFAGKGSLDWSLIPEVPELEDTLRILSIGKNPDNDIPLSSQDRISRYHALLRITKDYNYFLYDTSTNGTFVNDTKIPSHTYHKIKYRDNVSFGGADKLNWALVPSGKSSSSKKSAPVFAIVAILLVLAGGATAAYFYLGKHTNVYEKYENSVCMVVNQFLYTIDYGELGSWDVVVNDGRAAWYNAAQNSPMVATGTGFFISSDGKLLTNRHVALPWSVVKDDEPDVYNALVQLGNVAINAMVTKFKLNDTLLFRTQQQVDDNNTAIRAWSNAKFSIRGHSTDVSVLMNNTYFNSQKDLINCAVLKVADDERVDVGMLQTNSKTLPTQVKNLVDVNDIVADQDLKPGKKVFVLGFPMGFRLAQTSAGIKASFLNGQVSRETDGFAFGHNVAEEPGASGSPVFDEDGRLAGIHYAGVPNANGFRFAITAAQIKKMVNNGK